MKNQNTDQNKKAVIYASQALENEEAMALQTEAAQKLAAAHGYTDCEIVSESGCGSKIRPELQKLLERVDASEISTIVAVTPDRITRASILFDKTVARMAAAGTSLLAE